MTNWEQLLGLSVLCMQALQYAPNGIEPGLVSYPMI